MKWVRLGDRRRTPFRAVLADAQSADHGGRAHAGREAREDRLLGANVPILNPIRVAEEMAMLDTMSGGRVVAGMLRGTANEYVTYNINPAESRGRFEEALQLIKMAWTETEPFGWQGRYYQYRTISALAAPGAEATSENLYVRLFAGVG